MELNNNVIKGIGCLFLIAMAVSIAGNLIIVNLANQSDYLAVIFAKKSLVGIACVLLLINSLAVALIGVLSFPLLQYKSEVMARSYLIFRVMESVVLLIGVISLMVLMPLSDFFMEGIAANSSFYELLGKSLMKTNWYAYLTGMVILGIGGALFCFFLLKYSIVPKILSGLGVAGYLILGATSIVSIVGPKMELYVTLPVFLFEVIFGVWLVAIGINYKMLLAQEKA